MESQTKILGHPVHQILVAFPMGLLCTAALFDAVSVLTGDVMWSAVAFFMIGAGVVGGMLAAIFGLIDYVAIPAHTRAKRIASLHGSSSVMVIILFTLSWWLRAAPLLRPPPIALVCSFGGLALLGLAGWLGGELLNRLGVGIDDGAHLDARNSLTGPVRGALPAAYDYAASARLSAPLVTSPADDSRAPGG
jgi:uncharacterized membrane protein